MTPMKRHPISAQKLLQTSNPGVIDNLKDNLRNHRIKISEDKIVFSHSQVKNGLEKYKSDAERGVMLDDIHFYLNLDLTEVHPDIDVTRINTSEDDFLQQIASRKDKLDNSYSQDLLNLVLSWIPKSPEILVKSRNTQPNVNNEIYTKNSKDYLKVSISHFEVSFKNKDEDMEKIGNFPVNLEILYELTDQGFELVNVTTDSLRLIHYYLEEVSVEEFLKTQHLYFLEDEIKKITTLSDLQTKFDEQVQSASYVYISKHQNPKLDKLFGLFTPKNLTKSQMKYEKLVKDIALGQLFNLSNRLDNLSNEDKQLIVEIKEPHSRMHQFLTRDLEIPQTQLDLLLNILPPPKSTGLSNNI